MNLTINLTLPEFSGNLRKIADRLDDMSPAMKVGAMQAVSEAKARFQTSVGPDGKGWPKLFMPRPIRGSFGDLPLLNMGQLRASLTPESGPKWLKYGTTKGFPGRWLMQKGGTLVPKRGRWMSIPLTREALNTRARDFGRALHKRNTMTKFGHGTFLLDDAGDPQYRLIRKAIVPPRPFVGVSDRWLRWFPQMLVGYVMTGRLDQGTW